MDALLDSKISKTILRCSDPNRNLIFLPKEGYCFAGSFRFQCLFGEVTVGGYTAKGQTFSEDNFMQFTVHNKAQLPMNFIPSLNEGNNEDVDNSEQLFQRIRLIREGSVSDFKEFSQYSAAILIDTLPDIVESYLINRIGEYHKPLEKFKYTKVAGDCYIVHGLKMEYGNFVPLNNHIAQVSMIHEATEFVLKSGTTLMVAGNKDTGKSTTVRYIINYLLSKNAKTVYLLDTDIGQTEFTPPGCVSIFRVNEPILTPPFLHQKKSFSHTFCIGSLSPSGSEFNLYIQSIRQLMREFEQITTTDKILVVNTQGWVENLGATIMKELVDITHPATILNLVSPDVPNHDIPKIMFSQHHYQYPVRPRINLQTSKEVTAKVWRDYAVTGYFANCLGDKRFGEPDEDRTLANLMCYQVFFDKISLSFHHQRPPVVDNLIFNSLNCSIVALCGFLPGTNKNAYVKERMICNDTRWPRIWTFDTRNNGPLIKCYGYGFIRAISLEKKAFYIISPISIEDCEKVEFFFVPSNIVTPNFMFDRDDADSAPYLVEFKDEQERETAIRNRDKSLALLSSKFQNQTGLRATIRTRQATTKPDGPPKKKQRTK